MSVLLVGHPLGTPPDTGPLHPYIYRHSGGHHWFEPSIAHSVPCAFGCSVSKGAGVFTVKRGVR